MRSQHSPLPWRLGGLGWMSFRSEQGGAWIAEHVAPADAELIVRAVNSHAELLAVLKHCVELIDDYRTGGHLGEDDTAPALAVITKAEGR